MRALVAGISASITSIVRSINALWFQRRGRRHFKAQIEQAQAIRNKSVAQRAGEEKTPEESNAGLEVEASSLHKHPEKESALLSEEVTKLARPRKRQRSSGLEVDDRGSTHSSGVNLWKKGSACVSLANCATQAKGSRYFTS